MKSNVLYKVSLVLAISASLMGCNNNQKLSPTESTTQSETVSISIDDTEPATEHVDSTNASERESIVTTGILKELSDEIDNYGNRQALFTGDDGIDFIAIISEQTSCTENLTIGNYYEVYHSDVMTMSIPGQYPEVYEIKNLDTTSNLDNTIDQENVNEIIVD